MKEVLSKMKNNFKVLILLCVFLLILVGSYGFSQFLTGFKFTPVFQKGMCFTTWNKDTYNTAQAVESLKRLKEINVEWISVLTTWYQENCFSTGIFPSSKSPSDASVRYIIQKAHSLGLKVMLKPHLDILSTEYGSWRGEIQPVSETDWDKWFNSYSNFILHYAKIAEEEKVEILCIGTELTSATASHHEKWKDLIREIRKVYKGALTYAANWKDEYLHIRFWDELDYAGLDAYFPLSNRESPGYEELMEAWKRWLPEIEAWQASINKPVVFTEIGYRSSTRTVSSPWEHIPGKKVDLEAQARAYRALVDTFWEKEWFYGVYWWHWGTSVKMGGRLNRGFTPQNKPVEDYIRDIYSRKSPRLR